MAIAQMEAAVNAKYAHICSSRFQRDIDSLISDKLARYVNKRRLTCQDIVTIAGYLEEHFSLFLKVTIDRTPYSVFVSVADPPQELRRIFEEAGITMAFVQQQLKFLIPRVLSRDLVGIQYDLKYAFHLSQQGFPNGKILARIASGSTYENPTLNNFYLNLPGGSNRWNCFELDHEYQTKRLEVENEYNRLKGLYDSGRAVALEEITDSSFARARKESARANSVIKFGDDYAVKLIEMEEEIDRAIVRLGIDPRDLLRLMIRNASNNFAVTAEYLELLDRLLYPIYREVFLTGKYTLHELTR